MNECLQLDKLQKQRYRIYREDINMHQGNEKYSQKDESKLTNKMEYDYGMKY